MTSGGVAIDTEKSMTCIYKILSLDEWEAARAAGRFAGAAVDVRDGFIHFSAPHQAQETAARHFAGATDLALLEVAAEDLGGALKWEASRGGDLFPHLYGPLDSALVRRMAPLALGGDGAPDVRAVLARWLGTIETRVYYEDTDFSGVVYHANYLKYFERGRSDFLRAAGVTHAELYNAETPVAFSVRRMEIDFIAPARIDDLLSVETRFLSLSGARMQARQEIRRGAQALARASLEIACVSLSGRPRRLPAQVLQKLEPLLSPI